MVKTRGFCGQVGKLFIGSARNLHSFPQKREMEAHGELLSSLTIKGSDVLTTSKDGGAY